MSKPTPVEEVKLAADLFAKDTLKRMQTYRAAGNTGMVDYFEGMFMAWRTVQLMLDGASASSAFNVAQGELTLARAPEAEERK